MKNIYSPHDIINFFYVELTHLLVPEAVECEI